jgi:hypothetical protein
MKLQKLTNAALGDAFDRAYESWIRADNELARRRLNQVYTEIARREQTGLWSEEDWKAKSGVSRDV